MLGCIILLQKRTAYLGAPSALQLPTFAWSLPAVDRLSFVDSWSIRDVNLGLQNV